MERCGACAYMRRERCERTGALPLWGVCDRRGRYAHAHNIGCNLFELDPEPDPTDQPATRDPERILCAAVWFDDGQHHPHQPTATGVVIGGWRHHNCLGVAPALGIELTEEQRSGKMQGFLTSYGRFVDREEAMKIARNAEQLIGPLEPEHHTLSSEHLY